MIYKGPVHLLCFASITGHFQHLESPDVTNKSAHQRDTPVFAVKQCDVFGPKVMVPDWMLGFSSVTIRSEASNSGWGGGGKPDTPRCGPVCRVLCEHNTNGVTPPNPHAPPPLRFNKNHNT